MSSSSASASHISSLVNGQDDILPVSKTCYVITLKLCLSFTLFNITIQISDGLYIYLLYLYTNIMASVHTSYDIKFSCYMNQYVIFGVVIS